MKETPHKYITPKPNVPYGFGWYCNCKTKESRLNWYKVELERLIERQRITGFPDPRLKTYSDILLTYK